jgi:lysophospholipase L1-like esterase
MNDDLDAFAQVMRNLSQEFSVELLDLRSIFLDYISKNNRENKPFDVLTYDGVHLNSYGNQIIADQMAKFIRRSKN